MISNQYRMRRKSQRFFEHIQFLWSITVLYIQITVRVTVKRKFKQKASALFVRCVSGREPSYNPAALREPRDGPKKAKMNQRTTFMLITVYTGTITVEIHDVVFVLYVRAGMTEQEERNNKRGATDNDDERDDDNKEQWLKDKNNDKGGRQVQQQDRWLNDKKEGYDLFPIN